MDGHFVTVLAVALAAGLASPLGGALALWTRPSSLILSIAVGLAAGVLLGTFAFEMMPKALALSGVPLVVGGFVAGFGAVYLLDLYVNRWRVAGPEADQKARVDRLHRRLKPRGGPTSVLAGGTSAEELIEGLAIGVGGALDPSVALIVGLAICIDNLSEGMSLGELIASEDRAGGDRAGGDRAGGDRTGGHGAARRTLLWTSLIGASLFVSAMAGWFLLRDMPEAVQGVLLAAGAGGMFYLTVADLVPAAEAHHFQQSSAVAIGAGFLLVMVLTELI